MVSTGYRLVSRNKKNECEAIISLMEKNNFEEEKTEQ